jgi:hypothetical protein
MTDTQEELEHRLWDALDNVSTGTWTQDDISVINWATGVNWQPKEKQIDPQH